MGNDNGDRCKTSERASRDPSELVSTILREVDAAHAYVVELANAVTRADRRRAATLRADVNTAWTNAGAAIARLEQLSGRREIVARAALEHSQTAARPVFAALWQLVMSGNRKADTTANK